MTKITRSFIIIMSALLIVVLLASSFYIQKQTHKSEVMLSEYQARKENLSSSQEQLHSLLVDLNNTLQQEIIKQANLSSQLNNLKNQKIQVTTTTQASSGSHSSSSSSSSSSSQPTTTQPAVQTPSPPPQQAPSPPPAPSPTPAPTPVTRAS